MINSEFDLRESVHHELMTIKMHKNAAERLSCDESLLAKKGKFSRADISDLISVVNESQIKKCLVVLGKNQLEQEIAELLWNDLVKVYKTADDIPEDKLQSLGWIAMGIPARDFMNLSLTDIETIAAFGQWRNFSREQLTSLKQAIDYQWSYKGPSDLSSYDLSALGHVLCAFNTTQLAAIQPIAFKEAATDISNLINCPKEVIRQLATLATSSEAFGDPSEWTAIQVALIGCVIAGLDSVQQIHAEAFEGLSASSMKCLPSHTLQAISADQLSHLSLSAVNALTPAQRSSLDLEQTKAIQGTVKTFGSVLRSGSSFVRANHWSIYAAMVVHFGWSTILLFVHQSRPRQ
ncbi:otoancorin-like [Sipha flava]|uniref:Otoancorin-like n=1 Tax=Sipha flava TaxID=143950 RepID=A0A8B8GS91_9HEMI|nr:otoancorin-like [Sipha flava]